MENTRTRLGRRKAADEPTPPPDLDAARAAAERAELEAWRAYRKRRIAEQRKALADAEAAMARDGRQRSVHFPDGTATEWSKETPPKWWGVRDGAQGLEAQAMARAVEADRAHFDAIRNPGPAKGNGYDDAPAEVEHKVRMRDLVAAARGVTDHGYPDDEEDD